LKHVSCCKAKAVGLLGVEVGVFYFNGKWQYAQNEQLYTTFKCCSILDLIIYEIPQYKIFFCLVCFNLPFIS